MVSLIAFNMRLNRLGEAFKMLSAYTIERFMPADFSGHTSLLDSIPIITCSGKREGKVAREITDKGFCTTKGIYYYGLKLHALAFQRQPIYLSLNSSNSPLLRRTILIFLSKPGGGD